MKATNISPIKQDGKRLTRKFTGKVKDFVGNERNFYKKMLNAYLQGATHFFYGYAKDNEGKIMYDGNGKQKAMFVVEQEYSYI